MDLNNYLLHALLIAACIPVLDVIATWYYARGKRLRQEQAWDGEAAQAAAPAAAAPYALADGAQAQRSSSAGLPAQPPELSAQAQRLGVGFNGRQFTYAGHTYDRASDAEAYATLVLNKSNALRASLGISKP